jgi:multiple sugar transport system permease protein
MVETTIASSRPVENRSERGIPEWFMGYVFVAPAIIGFVIFYLFPTVRAFQISLTNWNMLRPAQFIGFSNYAELFSDSKFWDSTRITLLYVVYNIPLQTILGLVIAVIADRVAKSVVVRIIIIAPYLISGVVATMVWVLMLDPLLGMTDAFLHMIGVPPQPFFNSPDQAIMSVAGASIWRYVGFTALLFYAGLQSVPRNLYEAAKIDGASEVKMFFDITIPLLRPVLAFVLVTSVIGSFQIFDVIAVGTQGGPVNSTRVLLWYIYQNAFSYNRMGYASAVSVVLFVTLIVITMVQMRLLRAGHSDLN